MSQMMIKSPTAAGPMSTVYSASRSFALTQNNYVAGNDSASLADYATVDKWTMLRTFKMDGTASIAAGERAYLTQYAYDPAETGSSNGIAMWIENHSGELRIHAEAVAEDGNWAWEGAFVSFDQPGWSLTDWYCFVAACDDTEVYGGTMLVNLTQGEEVWDDDNGSMADYNTPIGNAGDSSGSPLSIVGWGCKAQCDGTSPVQPFDGLIYQSADWRDWEDVWFEAVRRSFCELDSIIDLESGALPYATPSMTWFYEGNPEDNYGTFDINSGGWWLHAPVVKSPDIPPGAEAIFMA